jgi:hypothetical protein
MIKREKLEQWIDRARFAVPSSDERPHSISVVSVEGLRKFLEQTADPDPIPMLNFAGSGMTLSHLSKILAEIDRAGCVTVIGISPRSSNLLELGAELAESAKRNQIDIT